MRLLKLLFALFALLALLPALSAQTTYYVTQTGGGAGTSCASANSASWFNTSGNWGSGAGEIAAGDTVTLCGTITSGLTFHGSGTSGSPITLLFASGSSMQDPEWATPAITFSGDSYIVIDGGTTGPGGGVIETTDASTGNDTNVSACFQGNGSSSYITIQNITCGPMYLRTSMTDPTQAGAGFNVPIGPHWVIRDSVFHDLYYGVVIGGGSAANNDLVYGNDIYNASTGVVDEDGGTGTTLTGNEIYNNNIHDGLVWSGCWNSCDDWNHNDGIHVWTSSGGEQDAPIVYGNHIYGQWGQYTTAYIFMEADGGTMPNPLVYNNLLTVGDATYSATNGLIEMKDNITGGMLYNNTFDDGTAGGNAIHWEGGSVTNALNNMFLNVGTAYANDDGTGTMTHDYTSYWETPSQGDTHMVTTNPDLGGVSGYVPSSSSPVATFGENLSSTFTTDLAGTARPASGGWTLGAYQAAGSTPTLTSPYITVAGTGGATTVDVGSTLQMVATCYYTGSITTDCTTTDTYGNAAGSWTSATTAHGRISSGGLVTGVASGTTSITAAVSGNTSAGDTLTVFPLFPTAPSYATEYANLQNVAGNPGTWTLCYLPGCNPGGNTGGTGSSAFAVASPSMSGASMSQTSTSGSTGYFDVLNYRHLGCANQPGATCAGVNNAVLDLYFYIPSTSANLQALEFDPDLDIDNLQFSLSLQCDSITGDWRLWNQSANSWEDAGLGCSLLAETNTWHHLQLHGTYNQSAQTYTYLDLWIDGAPVFQSLGTTYSAGAFTSDPLVEVRQQIDNNATATATNTVYYDNYNVWFWGTAATSAPTLSGVVLSGGLTIQ